MEAWTDPVSFVIQPPAARVRLDAALDLQRAFLGSGLTARLVVRARGTGRAVGVVPRLVAVEGGERVVILPGPEPPGPATLAPGEEAAFSWKCRVKAGGGFRLRAEVRGRESGTGLPVSARAERWH